MIFIYWNPAEIQSNGKDWNDCIKERRFDMKLPRTRLKCESAGPLIRAYHAWRGGGAEDREHQPRMLGPRFEAPRLLAWAQGS